MLFFWRKDSGALVGADRLIALLLFSLFEKHIRVMLFSLFEKHISVMWLYDYCSRKKQPMATNFCFHKRRTEWLHRELNTVMLTVTIFIN